MPSKTNELTRRILQFLYAAGVFAWRNNVLPVPLPGGGYRPGSKSGIPDIIGILPLSGRFIGIEVKTGRDRVRPEQEGFHSTARKLGAVILVIKDFEDFLTQWNQISSNHSPP